MNVLLLIDHAPDYRESFLRELGKHCNLTVLAHSCERDGLLQPAQRSGYAYHELNRTVGSKVRINCELNYFLTKISPDIVCVALNFRYPSRILTFLTNKKYSNKWIWWGQIFGRNDNYILKKMKMEILHRSVSNLVYTDSIVAKIKAVDRRITVHSFNNSQFSQNDFKKLANNHNHNSINILFVGRPQKRKRLELLYNLAKRRNDVLVRLVGPNMPEYFDNYSKLSNLEIFPRAMGNTLVNHFKWSNLILNPGHVGLLVMNAAAHNRPIVVDSKVEHAPEVILAKESNQPFIDFEDDDEVDEFLDSIKMKPEILNCLGEELYEVAKNKYTVEQMAINHLKIFTQVFSKS